LSTYLLELKEYGYIYQISCLTFDLPNEFQFEHDIFEVAVEILKTL